MESGVIASANAHAFRAYYDLTIRRLLLILFYVFGAITIPKVVGVILVSYLILHLTVFIVFYAISYSPDSEKFSSFVPESLRKINIRIIPGLYRERSIGHHGFIFAHPHNSIHESDGKSFTSAQVSLIHEFIHAKFHDFSTLIVLVFIAFMCSVILFLLLNSAIEIAIPDSVGEGAEEGLVGAGRVFIVIAGMMFVTVALLLIIIRNSLHDREYRADFFTSRIVGIEKYKNVLSSRLKRAKKGIFNPGREQRLLRVEHDYVELFPFRDGIILGTLMVGAFIGTALLGYVYIVDNENASNTLFYMIFADRFNPFVLINIALIYIVIAFKWRGRYLQGRLKYTTIFNLGCAAGILSISTLATAAYVSDGSVWGDQALQAVSTTGFWPFLIFYILIPLAAGIVYAGGILSLFFFVDLLIFSIARRKIDVETVEAVVLGQKYFIFPLACMAGIVAWIVFRVVVMLLHS